MTTASTNIYEQTLLKLLEALGWHGTPFAFEQVLRPQRTINSAAEMLSVLAQLGYRARRIAPKPDSWQQHTTILHLNAEGVQLWHRADIASPWNSPQRTLKGTCLVFETPADTQPNTRSLWGTLNHQYRFVILRLVVCTLFAHTCALLIPLLVIAAYSEAIGAGNQANIGGLALGMGLILAFETAFITMRARLLAWATARVQHHYQCRIFQHYLNLPLAYLEKQPATTHSQFLPMASAMIDFIGRSLMPVILEFPLVILLLGLLALFHPLLLAPVLMAAVCYALIYGLLRDRVHEADAKAARATGQRHQLEQETFQQLRAIQQDALQHVWQQRHRFFAETALASRVQQQYWRQILEQSAIFLTMLAGLGVMLAGAVLVWQGQLPIVLFIAGMLLCWRILMPLQELMTLMPRLADVRRAIQQVDTLLHTTPESPEGALYGLAGNRAPAVACHNISLRYASQRNPIISGLSFTLPGGQCLVISGSNGSGKSSLLKLLLGTYTPQLGTVRIDGVNLLQMNRTSLRHNVTVLEQNPALLPRTIADNLRCADNSADDTRLLHALQQAGLGDAIAQLPAGLYTPTSTLDQPQYWAMHLQIARAWLAPKPLILCDELPGSVLNSASGEAFMAYLQSLRGNHTLVIASHRSSIIAMADVLLRLTPEQRPHLVMPQIESSRHVAG